MSLVCSVIFIHHAFNANILDKDYAFSDGEILMVDNAVRTHFEPYERHFKEIGFNENTIKKYLQCTNIQTVTVPVPAKFLRASNVPTGLLNEMIAYLNSEERNHHNFSELLLFSCLSIYTWLFNENLYKRTRINHHWFRIFKNSRMVIFINLNFTNLPCNNESF